jgi:hypothetical protein
MQAEMFNILHHRGNTSQNNMRLHFIPARMAIIKKTTNADKDEEKVTLIHCWWKCKLVQLLWKSIGKFLRKQKQNYL